MIPEGRRDLNDIDPERRGGKGQRDLLSHLRPHFQLRECEKKQNAADHDERTRETDHHVAVFLELRDVGVLCIQPLEPEQKARRDPDADRVPEGAEPLVRAETVVVVLFHRRADDIEDDQPDRAVAVAHDEQIPVERRLVDRGEKEERKRQDGKPLFIELPQPRVEDGRQNEQKGKHIEIPELFGPDRKDHVLVILRRRHEPLDRLPHVEPHIQKKIVEPPEKGDAMVEKKERDDAPEHAQRPEPQPSFQFEGRMEPDETRDQGKQVHRPERRRFKRPGPDVVRRALRRDDARSRVGVNAADAEDMEHQNEHGGKDAKQFNTVILFPLQILHGFPFRSFFGKRFPRSDRSRRLFYCTTLKPIVQYSRVK